MTDRVIFDALALERTRGDKHRAEIRAEGWRAGAEAMRREAARIAAMEPGSREAAAAIRSLPIPEMPNG